MARGAGLGVLSSQRCRIEARTVRIEPPSPQGRVTGETVPLGMAGHATLQILSSSLAVAQEERSLGIVVSRLERPSRG